MFIANKIWYGTVLYGMVWLGTINFSLFCPLELLKHTKSQIPLRWLCNEYTYGINVFEVSEVEVFNARFELFQYFIMTSHVGRQYQLPQLLET